MRPAPAKIWHDAAVRIAGKKDVPFTSQQEKVLQYLWENFLDLYLGSPGQRHSKETILLLSRALSNNISTAYKRERFDFLAKGLEQGNMTIDGWSVPLGPVYVKVNREENYSRQDLFRPHTQADRFVEAFQISLESSDTLDRSALVGQLLVSAIFFGGLLDRTWIRPFQESLRNGHFYQEGPILWVDMVENHQTGTSDDPDGIEHIANRRLRRLVPDHLTRLLIYRYHRLRDGADHHAPLRDPWGCISAFMKAAAFSQNLVPRTLTELLGWAFARYLTLLPHSLVAYAAGKLEATSLPVAPWLRFISGRAIPVVKPPAEAQTEHSRVRPKIISNAHSQKSEQLQLLSELLKSLRFNKKSSKSNLRKPDGPGNGEGRMMRRKARRVVNIFLQRNRPRMSATLQLLLHWALRLLDQKVSYLERRQKQAIVPASMDRYLSAIGYALLYVAEDLPLHNLEPQELETTYEQVALRLRHDDYAMKRLQQFHGFLQVFYDAPEMEWGDLLEGDGKPRSAVSANIITHEVYQVMLYSLGWGQAQLTRWQRLHLISLILLYRCGLRPSELQAVRLKDIQGVTRYEIIIRNTRLNSIKTNSGIRRIPVSYMLLKDELNFVLNFYKMRLDEDKSFGGLLLSHPVHLRRILKDDELFEPIRQLLKSVTKDETIRLYHLRHSLLTRINTIIQLTDRYQIEFPEIVPPPEEIELVRNLFRYLNSNDFSGRNGLYLLAMLAGHASPDTTNRHYCHLLDLLLGHHLNNPVNCIQINWRSVMALTGLQRSTAYDLIKLPEDIHPLHDIVANESNKHRDELRHPMIRSEHAIELSIASDQNNGYLPPWEEAISLFTDNNKLTLLRRNKDEWEYATALYEVVRTYDGRKSKTVRKVVNYINQNYSKRHGGIAIHLASEAKLLRSFLADKKMPRSYFIAIHHSAKRLSNAEDEKIRKNWADVLGISQRLIVTGEHVPAKARMKSMITVKITLEEKKAKKIRAPRMSTGLIFTTELISFVMSQTCNKS